MVIELRQFSSKIQLTLVLAYTAISQVLRSNKLSKISHSTNICNFVFLSIDEMQKIHS